MRGSRTSQADRYRSSIHALAPLMFVMVSVVVAIVVMMFAATSSEAVAEELPRAEPRPVFRRHVLNANSQFSACAIFDVNRDGHPDIYCGGFWYQGPEWTRHRTRDVPMIRGRYDDYSNLPLDVNADGWTDVISVNYRSRSLFWTQHPGKSLGEWKTHLIDTPGSSETGLLADIDGDGVLDLLPNGTDYAAWYEIDHRSDGQEGPVLWQRHELPDAVVGHGVGIGDINGDGRQDVVAPNGWLEGPEDPRRGRWLWHGEFQLHRDGSIPIIVHDVDQDGDQDVIWGRGHNVGLYWLEQHTTDGHRAWTQHAIDTHWSSIHSIRMADLDGDGQADLVAGKRYLGHDGKDPGEWDPLEVIAYRFQASTRTWRTMPVSWGGHCGFDLDPAYGDVDLDGDIDLVAPTRAGLCLLENLGHPSPPTLVAADQQPVVPVYSADKPLLVLQGITSDEQPITTRLDWGYRRWQVLENMAKVMGDLPTSARRVPLDVVVESREPADGYERIRLSFATENGDRVPAYLLIPDGLTEPTPAMLCLHPTHALGKDQICGLGGNPSRFYAHELAQAGFICLAPDYPSFGDYPFDFQAWSDRYASGSMKAIWNNVRALDLLESWALVDKDRIGCIGHSLGGHNSLFTAAFDQRIRAVVTSCGFTSFADYDGGDLTGWTSDRYMPRIRRQWDSDPARMPFDFHEVLAAIAPRPIFISAPLADDNFSVDGVKKVVQRVRPVYGLFGYPDRLQVRYPETNHDFPAEIRRECYEWLKEAL